MYIPQQFPLACQNDKSKHSNKCCDQVANQHYETKNQNTFPLAPDAGDQKSGSDYPGTAAINDAEYKYEQVLRHIWQNKYNGYQEYEQYDTYCINNLDCFHGHRINLIYIGHLTLLHYIIIFSWFD